MSRVATSKDIFGRGKKAMTRVTVTRVTVRHPPAVAGIVFCRQSQINRQRMKYSELLFKLYIAAPDKLKESRPEAYYYFEKMIIMGVNSKKTVLDALKNMPTEELMQHFKDKDICDYLINITKSAINSTNSLKEKKELTKIIVIYKKFKRKMKNKKKKLRKKKQKIITKLIKKYSDNC